MISKREERKADRPARPYRTEHLIFRRSGPRVAWRHVGSVQASTSHGAVAAWIEQQLDDCGSLARCDLAAVAVWAFHAEHFEGAR